MGTRVGKSYNFFSLLNRIVDSFEMQLYTEHYDDASTLTCLCSAFLCVRVQATGT